MAVIGYGLAAVVLFIGARIEFLNYRAGNILPRHEYVDGDPNNGLVPWRISGVAARPGPTGLRDDAERDIANIQLRNAIKSIGLALYPLVFLLMLISGWLAWRYGWRIAAAPGATALVAACLAFFRGYMTSLGL